MRAHSCLNFLTSYSSIRFDLVFKFLPVIIEDVVTEEEIKQAEHWRNILELVYKLFEVILVLLKTLIFLLRPFILWWFTKQISTLAGNQVPSYFEWEVLFTMAIIGMGLLLFALLIGNMQNFLQALGRR